MPEPEHDDRHDLGLRYDLGVLRERSAAARTRPSRRAALQLLGAGGVGLLVAACSKGSSGSSATSTSAAGGTSSTTAAAGSSTSSGSGTGAGDLATVPEETGGPYPADGTNNGGLTVLDESGVVRSDLRSSFAGLSGTAAGIPTTVAFTVVSADTGRPLDGAALYLWHCDREGRYSLYSQGATDQNYLRGVQVADAAGKLAFTTVFPAAYQGRWPHMHFEVYPDVASITSTRSKLVTSQLALPEDAANAVYATDGYEASVSNMARTSLTSDMVFRDGVTLQTPSVSGDVDRGFALTITIAV